MRSIMNLRDFEYFNALADLLSYTQVAHQFDVSQPTISYAIKRLEQHYDCDLIKKDPSHRTVQLTREGAILKAHIHHILDEFVAVERAIEHAKKKQVHVGFPPIIRARILSKLLREKEAVNFISNFDLISGGSNELLSKLLSGRLDFSLIGSVTPLVHPNLTVQLLYQREFYIFASKDNPLSQKSEISFEEAADYPFILLEEGLFTLRRFKGLMISMTKRRKLYFIFLMFRRLVNWLSQILVLP